MTTPARAGRRVGIAFCFLVLAVGAAAAAMGAEPRRQERAESWDQHWEHFGERMGEHWGAYGERMGERWGGFGERMGEHWGAYGQRMGEHWGEFGQRMGDRWGAYGERTGHRWAHAGRDLGDRFEDLHDEVPEVVELTVESVMDALDTMLDAFDHH